MIIYLQLLPPQTLTLNPHSVLLSSPNPTKNPNPQKHPPNSQTPTFKKRKSQTPLTTTTTATTSGPGNLFRQKILYLQTLKINPQKALEKNPDFRSTPLETVKSVEHCLYSMGIERSAFRRLFEMFPELLSSNPYTDLYPVFDFLLNDIGLTYPDIRKSILRCPRLLISSVEHQLRPTLLFLKEFGFVGDYKINCRTAVLLVSSVENTLIPKLNFLCELGFDYSEVKTLVLRLPVLLTYSIEKNLRPKVEYFLEEMNGEMWELKRFPQYFAFSLEGRIKPRHRMLAKYGLQLSLPEMLKYSDAQFNVQWLDMRVRLVEEGRLGDGILISSPKPTKNPYRKHHPKTRIPLTPSLTTGGATTSDSGHGFCKKILYRKTLKVNPTKALEKPQISDQPHSKPSCLSSMDIEHSAFGRIFENQTTSRSLTPIFKSPSLTALDCIYSVNNQLRPALNPQRKEEKNSEILVLH